MPIIWIRHLRSTDWQLAGGKASNLGELLQITPHVPEGFCVTTDVLESYAQIVGIADQIKRMRSSRDLTDPEQLAAFSGEVGRLFLAQEIPAPLASEIEHFYDALGRQPGAESPIVAVRSSATCEDGPQHSFAGQFDTFLGVAGLAAVLAAIRQCWASLYTERAIRYCTAKAIEHATLLMAVIVQEVVNAEKSGVAFTAHPTTGERVIAIEANWGLGDTVVSGRVTPDEFVVSSDYVSVRQSLGSKKRMTTLIDGRYEECEVAEERRRTSCMTKPEILQVAQLAVAAESHFGMPQDIEWAIADSQVHLLQARPITTLDLQAEWSPR